MQYLPEKEDLLEAVAYFLAKQAAPASEDPALAFRLKVAAHLVLGAAREARAEGEQDREVIGLLGRVLGIETVVPLDPAARHAQIRELFDRLVDRVQDPRTDEATLSELRRAVMTILAGELKVIQPKFDLALDLESRKKR